MVVALVDMERAFVPPQHFIRLVQRRYVYILNGMFQLLTFLMLMQHRECCYLKAGTTHLFINQIVTFNVWFFLCFCFNLSFLFIPGWKGSGGRKR